MVVDADRPGTWGLFLWLSYFFSNTFIWRRRNKPDFKVIIGCKLSIWPQGGDLLSFSQSLNVQAYLIPYKCLKYFPKHSQKWSGKRQQSLKNNIKQTELREKVKLSWILFSSGLALSFPLIFLSIHHDVLKYSSSFFWELFVLLFVNMTEEMCFSKALC